MWLRDLLSTSVNFLCCCETFRQLPLISVRLRDILSSCVNFRAAGRLFVNFRQLSVRLEYLPSTAINFPCVQKTFRQLFVWLESPLSTSVNFLFSRETIRKIPSAFHVAETPSARLHQLCVTPGEPSVSFRQYSMWPGDLPPISVNFDESSPGRKGSLRKVTEGSQLHPKLMEGLPAVGKFDGS